MKKIPVMLTIRGEPVSYTHLLGCCATAGNLAHEGHIAAGIHRIGVLANPAPGHIDICRIGEIKVPGGSRCV